MAIGSFGQRGGKCVRKRWRRARGKQLQGSGEVEGLKWIATDCSSPGDSGRGCVRRRRGHGD